MELLAALESNTNGTEGGKKRYKKRALCLFFLLLIIIMSLELALNLFSKIETSTLDKLINFLTNKTSSTYNATVSIM